MVRLQFYIIAFFCVLFVSCNTTLVPSYIKKNFSNCYGGDRTGLDTIINIQGFYRQLKEYDKWGEYAVYEHRIDTFEIYFFLSADGMFFYNIIFNGKYRRNRNMKFPYPSYGKGCYVINRDTIIAQCISKFTQTNFVAWEYKYKIIDKNTLLFVSSKALHRTNPIPAIVLERQEQKEREFEKVFGRKRVNSDTARFVPLEEIPPSDCWLKKKRWFWCDKEKFRTWKKEKKR